MVEKLIGIWAVSSHRPGAVYALAFVVAMTASTLVGANVASADQVQVQSYQRASQSEACAAQPGETPWQASWGPDSSWNPAWEQWANNGTGGWVCTRSITWARTPVAPTPASTSTAPTAVTGVSGNTTVALTWVAPTSTGGDVITGYRVQISTTSVGGYADAAGCATASSSTALSCTATGLTNGTAYFFKVAAITSSGTGTYSAPSVSVTPAVPCAGGGTCAVGDVGPGGGLVFLISGGLTYEMAPKTWNGGSEDPTNSWCNVATNVTGAASVAVGAGASNTAAIDAACSSGAGQAASDLVLGGKTDWFLPSKNELFEMYSYSLVMPASVAATYAFNSATYWSSTQNDTSFASTLSFSGGTVGNVFELLYLRVRPVRAF